MNGLVTVANMIELGQIEAGVVVATESGRPLVDATVRHLVSKSTNGLAGKDLRPAFASLTIGSGSVAAVLTSRRVAKVPGRRLLGGAVRQVTEHHALCRSAPDQGFAGEAHPLMDTDAEAVLENGTRLAAGTWRALLAELGWKDAGDTKLFCHQVGASYRRQLFAALDLDPKNDHPTLDALGNVGSVSCPISLSMAIEEARPGGRPAGHARDRERAELGDARAVLGVTFDPKESAASTRGRREARAAGRGEPACTSTRASRTRRPSSCSTGTRPGPSTTAAW